MSMVQHHRVILQHLAFLKHFVILPRTDNPRGVHSVGKERFSFGGRRCIVNRLHLPVCCPNDHCMARSEGPTASSGDSGALRDEATRTALKTTFLLHDTHGSGAVIQKGIDLHQGFIRFVRLTLPDNDRVRMKKAHHDVGFPSLYRSTYVFRYIYGREVQTMK